MKQFLFSLSVPIMICVLLTASCNTNVQTDLPPKVKWIKLFNGKNLDGWTPKFKGHAVGHNYKDTFRVEDGLLSVDYSNYDEFKGEYGHLFYSEAYSYYVLRAKYRFVGEQASGGEEWAYRNNGIMIHSQSPESMKQDQSFPASVEIQLLGGNGIDNRSTANVCTPYSHIVISGKLVRKHCINSTSETFHGDQWVTVEVEVKGSEIIKHRVNGVLVSVYNFPQIDEKNIKTHSQLYGGVQMKGGYIAIQAETHPTQFKSIEILPL